jgi:hypothetical protein
MYEKDKPEDCMEYMQAVQEYWNIMGLDQKIRERKLEELRDLGKFSFYQKIVRYQTFYSKSRKSTNIFKCHHY